MTRAGSAAPARVGSLLVALATLALPLLGIVLGALERPAPAPLAAPPSPPAEDETVLAVEPEPAATPAQVEPPPPPPPTPQPVAQPPFNPFPRWTREESMNFLMLGIDRRPDEEIYRTDTIILANLDLRAPHATLISIPRDLVVNIPGYGQDRINAVYAVGEVEKRPGGGLALLRSTIERNFGLPVHHFAAIDFNCFRGAVDALGGVTVTIPSRIYDPYYPTDDYGYKTVTFEPGRQWLDGERALEYARTRYGDTDFGRMRRQQQLLTALKEQALQVRTLSALPQAVRACGGISSDLNVIDLVALGSTARELRQSDIALKVIDERLAVPSIAPSGAAVLIPRWDAIRAMLRDAIPSSMASASATN